MLMTVWEGEWHAVVFGLRGGGGEDRRSTKTVMSVGWDGMILG